MHSFCAAPRAPANFRKPQQVARRTRFEFDGAPGHRRHLRGDEPRPTPLLVLQRANPPGPLPRTLTPLDLELDVAHVGRNVLLFKSAREPSGLQGAAVEPG